MSLTLPNHIRLNLIFLHELHRNVCQIHQLKDKNQNETPVGEVNKEIFLKIIFEFTFCN